MYVLDIFLLLTCMTKICKLKLDCNGDLSNWLKTNKHLYESQKETQLLLSVRDLGLIFSE